MNYADQEHCGNSNTRIWSRPSSRNKDYLELDIDIPEIGELSAVVSLNTSVSPGVLRNTALLNYLNNPSKETLQAFLQNQVGQWSSQVEAWINDLRKYKEEFAELEKQFKATAEGSL